jgi:hypothetical protein
MYTLYFVLMRAEQQARQNILAQLACMTSRAVLFVAIKLVQELSVFPLYLEPGRVPSLRFTAPLYFSFRENLIARFGASAKIGDAMPAQRSIVYMCYMLAYCMLLWR